MNLNLDKVNTAMWLCLLIYKQPYKATWDNVVAVILAAHLLLMLVSGMALKLYEATPGQDEYQRAGFGFVMIFVSVLCTLLGLGSILAGTPCLRECLMKRLMGTPKAEKSMHAPEDFDLPNRPKEKMTI